MRVAVLGAGGPAGVNTARALRAAGHDVLAVDSNERRLIFCRELATCVHIPHLEAEEIDDLRADVVLPQPDVLVPLVARMRIEANTLLPDLDVIERCQDKERTARAWHKDGLRRHRPIRITEPLPDHLHIARDTFGFPFWVRATRGAGARGAILARTLTQAYHWIRFWQERGSNDTWIAEEYLPGRDFAWSGVWFDGELQASFARERLEYLYPHLTPEGLTGTPTIARITHDESVNAMAVRAIEAIDPRPHGIYSVDLKGDAHGAPRPTEINAGRGFTTFGLWSLWGPNFVDLAVRLAQYGDSWWLIRPDLSPPESVNALPDGLTLYRHIDAGHMFERERALV